MASRDSTNIEVGTPIGNGWRVDRRLGQGAHATAYAVSRRPEFPHPPAGFPPELVFKVAHLNDQTLTESERRRVLMALVTEYEIARSVDHPNIIKVYDVFPTEHGEPVMAVERAATSLEHELATRGGQLTPSHAAQIFADIAAGLAHLHHSGCVHSDLRPPNLLRVDLPTGSAWKIADFGVATRVDGTTRTEPGAVPLALDYQPPEAPHNGKLGPLADIWAYGVSLHQTLAGRHPYPGDSEEAVYEAVLRRDAHLAADLHPELRDIITACLTPDPDARLHAVSGASHSGDTVTLVPAAALHDRVCHIARRLNPTITACPHHAPDSSPSPNGPPPAVSFPLARPRRRRRRRVMLINAVVVLLTLVTTVTGVAVAHSQSGDHAPPQQAAFASDTNKAPDIAPSSSTAAPPNGPSTSAPSTPTSQAATPGDHPPAVTNLNPSTAGISAFPTQAPAAQPDPGTAPDPGPTLTTALATPPAAPPVTVTDAPTQPAALHSTPPASTAASCSTTGGDHSVVTFHNATSHPVNWLWVDFSCQEQLYNTIPAGQDTWQSTYVGHRWRARDTVTNQILSDQTATTPVALPCFRQVSNAATLRVANNTSNTVTVYYVRDDCTEIRIVDIAGTTSIDQPVYLNQNWRLRQGTALLRDLAITSNPQLVSLT